jgi:hypothetical protein
MNVWKFLVVGSFFSGLVVACSGAKVGFMQDCKTSDDCDSGFSCGAHGDIAGQCTRDCSADSDCANLGSKAYCQDVEHNVSECALSCDSDADCPSHHCKTETDTFTGQRLYLYCIP